MTGTVSVLMAVYAGTPPDQLALALDSLVGQTRRADEIVLVVDGPVGEAHHEVLAAHADAVTRVDLPERVGLGRALQTGLAECCGEWVARADADDVNRPDRLATQLAVLERSGADVCSASMREIAGPSMRTVGLRRSLTAHRDFASRMRMTNPVHHPTVVFRREAAVRAGGYRHLPLLEDYDLWARMLRGGAHFVGIDEPLVSYRVDGMLQRRADDSLARSEHQLQRNLRAYGLVGWPRSVRNTIVRGAYRRMPESLRSRVYTRIFRSPSDD